MCIRDRDFSYYLENKTGMPNEGYRVMKNEQEHMYQNKPPTPRRLYPSKQMAVRQ